MYPRLCRLLPTFRGYLLANSLDKYGRVIAFVFSGNPARSDGALAEVTADELATSVNFRLVEGGFVYPTFYATLEPALRTAFAAAGQSARQAEKGLWSQAVGTPTRIARIPSLQELQQLTLFPTLHRRLNGYLKDHATLDGLKSWIRADPESRNKSVLRLDTGTVTDLAGIVETTSATVRLTLDPEQFAFVDGPPIEVPVEIPTAPKPQLEPGDVRIVGALVNPVGADRGAERVTLLNTTSQPIDLTGCSLADNVRSAALSGALNPGAVLQLATGLELGNQGDRLVLSSAGVEIDRVSWQAAEVKQGRTLVFRA